MAAQKKLGCFDVLQCTPKNDQTFSQKMQSTAQCPLRKITFIIICYYYFVTYYVHAVSFLFFDAKCVIIVSCLIYIIVLFYNTIYVVEMGQWAMTTKSMLRKKVLILIVTPLTKGVAVS